MSAGTETILRCRGLFKRFGEEFAVSDLDLCVEAGEVAALIGLNGAGKMVYAADHEAAVIDV